MYVGVHGQLAGNGAKLTSSTKKITILGVLALAVVLYNQNTEILSNKLLQSSLGRPFSTPCNRALDRTHTTVVTC